MGGGKEGSLPAPRTRHKQDRGKVALFDGGRRAAGRQGGSGSARRIVVGDSRHSEPRRGAVVSVCSRWRLASYLRAVCGQCSGGRIWPGLEPRIARLTVAFWGLLCTFCARRALLHGSADAAGPSGSVASRGCNESCVAIGRRRRPGRRATRIKFRPISVSSNMDAGRSRAIGWAARCAHAPSCAATDPGTPCALLSPEHVPCPATAQRLDRTTCCPPSLPQGPPQHPPPHSVPTCRTPTHRHRCGPVWWTTQRHTRRSPWSLRCHS